MKKMMNKSAAILISALLVVTCFTGCKKGKKIEVKKAEPEPVVKVLAEDGTVISLLADGVNPDFAGENSVGVIGENLVENGGAEEDDDVVPTNIMGDGASVEIDEAGTGADGKGHAWKVISNESWGCIEIDMTDYYGQGKSYYVSAKVRVTPEDKAELSNRRPVWKAELGYLLRSGGYKNACDEKGKAIYQTVPGWPGIYPWNGSWYSEDENGPLGKEYASGTLAGNVKTFEVGENGSDWITVEGVIDSKNIEAMIDNSGLYEFIVKFTLGDRLADALGGYSYHLDDIVIKDLNTDKVYTDSKGEKKYQGSTWVDPNPYDDEDDEDWDEDDE